MSRSRLARRSRSRAFDMSPPVTVFLRMSGMGNASLLSCGGDIGLSAGFFFPNRSISVVSAKGASWPFLRNRSIPLAFLLFWAVVDYYRFRSLRLGLIVEGRSCHLAGGVCRRGRVRYVRSGLSLWCLRL